jgi:hypothetical protein
MQLQSDCDWIRRYTTAEGRDIFGEWLANLADLKAHLGVISSVPHLPHLHIAVCIKSALLGPRERNAGHIAGQRNADACERHTEKINLAEHNKTTKHCQPDNEKER